MADFISSSIIDFTTSFHQTVSQQDPDANVFFSPWSIATAFAVVLAGARGKSAEQLIRVFNWNSKYDAAFHQLMGGLLDAIDELNSSKNRVKLANKMWVHKGVALQQKFLDIVRQSYKSDVGISDFIRDSEAVRQEINSWVADHTEQKVKDLFPSGSIDANSRVALANAIYFKGTWSKPFDKKLTTSDDFFVADDKSIKVDMMYSNTEVKLKYDDKARCKIVELPYHKEVFSMVVVVPDDVLGVLELEKGLTPAKVKEWSQDLRPEEIDIYLPKFKIEHSIELKDMMMKLGVKDVFSDMADLSGISEEEKLLISGAFHKAYVQVDEEGTEAAAATGLAMMVMSMPEVVKIDRPFLFFIKENRSGVVLFFGKVMNPST